MQVPLMLIKSPQVYTPWFNELHNRVLFFLRFLFLEIRIPKIKILNFDKNSKLPKIKIWEMTKV